MSDKPEGSSVKRPNLFIKNPQQHSHDTHFSIQKTSPRLNNGGGLLVKRNNATGPLEELVQCPICLERLNSSRMLPCQHTFCLACLQLTFRRNDSQSINCPTCQIKHTIDDEIDIHALPSNLYIDSLLDLLNSPNGTIMTPNVVGADPQFFEIRCFKCQTSCTGNIQKCLHCKLKFCNICWETHMTELLEQMVALREKLSLAKQRINHRFENFKDRCDQTKARATISIEEKIVELQQKKVEAEADCERLVEEAGQSRDELLEKIHQIQLSIQDSSSGPLSEQASAFVNFHGEISVVFNEIAQWMEDKVVYNKNSNAIELESMVAVGTEAPETPFDNVKNERDNFVNRELKKQMSTNSEYVLNHLKVRDFKPKLFWTRCSRPTGVRVAPWTFEGYNLLYIAGSESRLVYGIERNSGKIFHRISHSEMLFPHFIEFSKDREEIFVSDKWKHCIFVFSKSGEYLRMLGSKGEAEGCFRSPEGLAIGKTNNIYVCDTGNNRVQYLDIVDGRMVMQFGLLGKEQIYNSLKRKKIAKRVDLNAPTSLAVLEDKILVLDTGNRRVKAFSKRGDLLSEFGQFGSGKGQFRFPEAIALDHLGYIYVGDSGNTRVQIFQPNGVFVTSFGVKGSTAGKFEWISGITVTEDLDIIVSDYKNHSVQVF